MLHGNIVFSLSSPLLKCCCFIASSAVAASSCPMLCCGHGSSCHSLPVLSLVTVWTLWWRIPPRPWDRQPEAHSNRGISGEEYTGQKYCLDFHQKFDTCHLIYLGIFYFCNDFLWEGTYFLAAQIINFGSPVSHLVSAVWPRMHYWFWVWQSLIRHRVYTVNSQIDLGSSWE